MRNYEPTYYESIVKSCLPAGAELVVCNSCNHNKLVQVIDIDCDGVPEIMATYQLCQQVYFIVLKEHRGCWQVISETKLNNTRHNMMVDLHQNRIDLQQNGTYLQQNRTEYIADDEIEEIADRSAEENIGNETEKVEDNEIEKIEDNEIEEIIDNEAEKVEDNEAEEIADKEIEQMIDDSQLIEDYYIKKLTATAMLFPAMVKTTNGQKYGYINDKGKFVIKPQYSYAMDFQKNGLAIVEVAGKNGIIDLEGRYIVKPIYQTISEFSEGRAAVADSKGYWVINEQGKILTSKPHDYIGQYSEGRVVVADTDKASGNFLYGYLDLNGKEVIPKKYLSATDFQNKRAIVQLANNKFAMIDLQGKIMHTYNYAFVGSPGDGLLAYQEKLDGKYGYIDTQGKVVIKPKFSWAQPFENGRAVVNLSEEATNEVGIINQKGEYVVSPKYNIILSLGDKRYAIGKAINPAQPFLGSKYALADNDGKLLTEFEFDNIAEYNQGVASVSNGELTYFIDERGTRVRSLPTIKGSGTMSIQNNGNVIQANRDLRIFYLDRLGKIIWRPNKIIPLSNKYKVIEKKYKPNDNYLVYYPEIAGMQDVRIERQVNQKLKNMSQVKPIPADKQLDYSYTGDFSVEFYKKQLVVIKLVGYNFPFGAAHGMPTQIYAQIDLVTGQFYELKDLFKPNSNYVKVLSDIIAHQIKTDPQYSYVFPDSYTGIKPNQPFFVTANALNIYFEPYEIAPYVAGFPTFKIPFAEIDNIINHRGNFWRSFH